MIKTVYFCAYQSDDAQLQTVHCQHRPVPTHDYRFPELPILPEKQQKPGQGFYSNNVSTRVRFGLYCEVIENVIHFTPKVKTYTTNC